jgi:uncharacterized membrane protein YqiK
MLERVVEQDTQTRTELEAKLESKEQETERLREAVVQAEIKAARAEAEQEIKAARADADRQSKAARAEADQQVQLMKLQHRHEVDQLEANATRIKLRDQQLVTLQQRLESMHASKLLTEGELQNLEDMICDSYESDDTAKPSGEDEVSRLIALAEKIVHDTLLARQLRRKFISS